jgi:hypothetical protein
MRSYYGAAALCVFHNVTVSGCVVYGQSEWREIWQMGDPETLCHLFQLGCLLAAIEFDFLQAVVCFFKI